MKLLVISSIFILLQLNSAQKYYVAKPKTFLLKSRYERYLEEQKDNKIFEADKYQNETILRERSIEFERMDKIIKDHNEMQKIGLVSFHRKLMRYSDWGLDAKMKRLCGTRMGRKPRALTNSAMVRLIKGWPKLPNGTEVNHCHFPNPIPDQLACGCCWAWSTAQVVEHYLMVKKGIRVQLSVQQMVDCDSSNDACDGGWPTNAFKYVQLFGLASAREYSYKNTKQKVCRRSAYHIFLQPQYILKPIEVELKGDEESLKKLVYRFGAGVVAVHADEAFLSINAGRYKNATCPKNEPNHAMVLCGFGEDEGGPYWIVRNSWSSSWGEYGYVKMAMGNTCGVADFFMWPNILGEKLDPFEVEEQRIFDDHVADYLMY